MPGAIAAAIVGATVGAGATIAAAFITAATYVAFAAATSYILKKTVQAPSLADRMAGLQQTIRSPAASRRLVYGRAKVGGTLAYIGSTGPDNNVLHLAVTLAGHEVDGVETVYANDALSTDSRYVKAPRISGATDIAFAADGAFGRIESISTRMNPGSFDSSFTVIEVTGSAANDGLYRIRGTGKTDTSDGFLRVLRIDGGAIVNEAAGAAVTIRERYLWTTAHLGASDQAADADMVARLADWTSEHRLRGVAYLYTAMAHHSSVWTSGLPNFTVVLRGKKCYDPRTGLTAWTQNPALILADYLCDPLFGLAVDYATEIDEPALIAAANICDELVDGAPRYTCDAVIESSEEPETVLPKLAGAMAGGYAYSGGVWTIRAGAYTAPTVTLTEQHARGNIKVQPRLSRQDLFNAVRGTYLSHSHNYQTVDIPPISDSAAIAQDNGETIWADIELPYTASNAVAQRLAWIALAKARQQITVEYPTTLAGMQVRAGGTVALTNTRFGWSEKPFEVIGWRFAVYDDAAGAPALGVDLTLRETASTVYTGVATLPVDASPDTTLPSPWELDAPTDLVMESGTEHLLIQADGTIISRIYVEWTPPAKASAPRYEIEYSDPTGQRVTVQSNGPNTYLAPVNDGDEYAVRVRALNRIGAQSDWLSGTHTAIGKTEPPPDVESFTVVRMADGTRRYSWSLSEPPLDLAGYRIRYQIGTTFDWGTATEMHKGLLTRSPIESNDLAAGTYTFGIIAEDTTGNQSAVPMTVTATLGDPRLRDVLLSHYSHDQGWPGTLSEGLIDSANVLRAGASWAMLPDTWAELPDSWDAIAGTGQIVYETVVLDAGANAAFTPLVTATGDGTFAITMRTGTAADGTAAGIYGPILPVSGVRYIQIRVVATGTSPKVSSLSILLDGEPVLDEYDDINTATNAEVWFERIAAGHFRVAARKEMASINSAAIRAIQNVTTPHSWALVSKSAIVTGNPKPAAEFKVWNSAGVLVDALVDVELKGPKAS